MRVKFGVLVNTGLGVDDSMGVRSVAIVGENVSKIGLAQNMALRIAITPSKPPPQDHRNRLLVWRVISALVGTSRRIFCMVAGSRIGASVLSAGLLADILINSSFTAMINSFMLW